MRLMIRDVAFPDEENSKGLGSMAEPISFCSPQTSLLNRMEGFNRYLSVRIA